MPVEIRIATSFVRRLSHAPRPGVAAALRIAALHIVLWLPLVVSAWPVGHARAQSQPGVEGADPALLESVVVTATRSPAAALGVPASVTVVEPRELERRAPVRFGDALADVPGVYVRGAALGTSFPGSGQAVLSLRGIPRTPRTLVMIDGQPVNNALSGGVNVAGIPLAGIERVEVVRGPYSALYGGAAMGGVVNFISARPDSPLTELRAGAGSLQQRGATIVHRRRYESGLGIAMSVEYRESEGEPDSDFVIKAPAPGPGGTAVGGARRTQDPDGSLRYWVGTQGARPWSQANAQLALHFDPAPATQWVVGVGWADYDVGRSRPHSFLLDAAGVPVFAGVVRFDDAGTPRRLTLADTDWFTATPSGERDRRVFVRTRHRLERGGELRAQLGMLRHDFSFTQPTPGAASFNTGPGVFTDQPNRRIDADVSLRTPVSESWSLVGGFALNRSRLERGNFALSSWRDSESAQSLLDADGGTSSNVALYFQSEHDLAPGWTAFLGGRYDRFETEGHVFSSTPPVVDTHFASRSFDQFSPKLALVWEARRWLSLHASWGQGFRPPALLDLYGRTVIRVGPRIVENAPAPGLVPERVRAFELGADMDFGRGARVSVSVYRQSLEDLIYRHTIASTPTRTQTRNENVGQADVDGIEASVRWPTAVSGLRAFGALTHQFRYAIARNDALPQTVGKKLTDVPRTTWSAGLEYERGPWAGLIALRHVDHVFGSGDDLNLDTVQGVFGSFDGYTVASARLAWRFDRHWSAQLAIDNLTDRDYFVFYKQPGRTVYGEVSYRF